jgi:hypothetical protein
MADPKPKGETEIIHRMKNHLCIILGFCDLLLADFPAPDGHHQDLTEIMKAAQEALAMMPEFAARLRPLNGDGDAITQPPAASDRRCV